MRWMPKPPEAVAAGRSAGSRSDADVRHTTLQPEWVHMPPEGDVEAKWIGPQVVPVLQGEVLSDEPGPSGVDVIARVAARPRRMMRGSSRLSECRSMSVCWTPGG